MAGKIEELEKFKRAIDDKIRDINKLIGKYRDEKGSVEKKIRDLQKLVIKYDEKIHDLEKVRFAYERKSKPI